MTTKMLTGATAGSLILLASMAIPELAQAGTLSFSASVPGSGGVQSTNFSETISVPKFDPGLGDLLSVAIKLTGTVEGSVRGESSDASETNLTLALQATLTAALDEGGFLGAFDLVTAIPVVSETQTVTAFDGVVDFGGTSGFSILDASNTALDAATITADSSLFFDLVSGQEVLDAFTASSAGVVENVSLIVDAIGQSSATGPGNVSSSFSTSAGATLNIHYNFEGNTPVPTPEPTGLLGAGVVLGLGALAQRLKRS